VPEIVGGEVSDGGSGVTVEVGAEKTHAPYPPALPALSPTMILDPTSFEVSV
jgi:hypothetical protein